MSGPIHTILGHFRQKHTEVTGHEYLVTWGKDNKIIKDMCNTYPWEKITQMIDLFFEQAKKDEFLQNSGLSIGVFRSQVPKLILKLGNGRKDANRGRL